MFCDLKRNRQIKALRESSSKWGVQISRVKCDCRVDHVLLGIPVTIKSDKLARASLLERLEPGATTTADIDGGLWLEQRPQDLHIFFCAQIGASNLAPVEGIVIQRVIRLSG